MADVLISIINNRDLIARNIQNPNMQGSMLVNPYATIQQRNYIGTANNGNVKYYYNGPNQCTNKWYNVTAGTPYLIMASANPGSQFRWAFSEDEISDVGEIGGPTSNNCMSVYAKDSPEPYLNFIYTPEANGYLGGTIDTLGNYNTEVYVFDLSSII